MAKKIWLTALLIITVILCCSVSALAVLKAQHIDNVEKAVMVQNTSSSLSIEWDSVENADGYKIYMKDNESGEYSLVGNVEGEDVLKYDLSELAGASVYDLRITAFRYFREDVFESELAMDLRVHTLPDKPQQMMSSDTEGVLDIKWQAVNNAVGYELEYAKDKELKDKESESFDDAKQCEFKREGLTPNDIYFSRIRAYYNVDSERVYSEWSDIAEVKIKEKVVMVSNIDPKKPMIALSFDDGPGYPNGNEPNPTAVILDVLEEYGARATFFMCASRIGGSNDQCLKRELDLGCELGNHTFDHTHYGKKVTASDISRCSDRIKEKCGKAPTIFRCPGGTITADIRKECVREGMPLAYWSIDTQDWKTRDPQKIYDTAIKHAYDGAIILMHDIYPETAEAVRKIVPKLIEDGYQVVGVTEMLTVKNGNTPPKSGEQYLDYKTINNNTK